MKVVNSVDKYDLSKDANVDPTDFDVMAWTLNDLIFLADLPNLEKNNSQNGFYSVEKQSHHVRLLVVFGNALVEGYVCSLASETGIAKKLKKKPRDVSTVELIQNLHLNPENLTVGSLDNLEIRLGGIKSLRDIIAHGLDFESAINYEDKRKSIELAGLEPNPWNLSETHFAIVLEAFDDVMGIFNSVQ